MLGTGEVPQIVGALGGSAAPLTAPVSRRMRVPSAVALERPPAARRRTELPTYIYDADTPRVLATPRHYAYVKIAEGCDYKCAFCIIPEAARRTTAAARPSRSSTEARALAARGVKRAAPHLARTRRFYGIDRGERGALAAPPARAERGRRPRVDPAALPLSRRPSTTRCSTRWPSATRSSSTSTCRCSTRPMPCSSG